jgi:CBS domain-containing protein
MLVADAMTRHAETIGPDETLQAAARKMKALNIGVLPVCERDRIIGVLTDRDIVVRGVVEGVYPAKATVRDCMTPQVVYCFEEQPLHEAARLMEEHSIRRIIVLDTNKRLIGLLSSDDLAMTAGGLAVDVIERCVDPDWKPGSHWQRIS